MKYKYVIMYWITFIMRHTECILVKFDSTRSACLIGAPRYQNFWENFFIFPCRKNIVARD